MATLGEYISKGSGTTKLLLHLNGNSTDDSGNSNNGTDTSITYSQANGRFGQGAGFNGSSSKITLTTNPNPTIFTFSFWCKISGGSVIGSNTTGQGNLNIQTTPLNGTIILIKSGLVIIGTSNTGSTFSNIWTNFIITYNQTTGVFNFYRDGKPYGSGTNIQTLTSATLNLGRNDSGEWLSGALDEVILENVAWTPAQIAKYYTMTKGRFGIL